MACCRKFRPQKDSLDVAITQPRAYRASSIKIYVTSFAHGMGHDTPDLWCNNYAIERAIQGDLSHGQYFTNILRAVLGFSMVYNI